MSNEWDEWDEWGIRLWLKSWWRRQAIAARWRFSRSESRHIVRQSERVIPALRAARNVTHYQCPNCGLFFYDNPPVVANVQEPSQPWQCFKCGIATVTRVHPDNVPAPVAASVAERTHAFYRRVADRAHYKCSEKHRQREKRWKAKQSLSS